MRWPMTPPGFVAHRRAFRVSLALLFAVAFVSMPVAATASEPRADAAPAVDAAVGRAAHEAPLRELVGFATDAAVADGLWTELGEMYLQRGSRFVTGATVAYGWR